MKQTLIIGLVLLLILAACGGSTPTESATSSDSAVSANTASTTDSVAAESVVPESEDPPTAEAAPADSSATDSSATEMSSTTETAVEDTAVAGDTVAGRIASGLDPDTGLEINPTEVLPGVEYLVRGEIVSMNLTPQTDPEFLLQAPNGTRYRIHSQGLSEIFLEDGTQLKPHEYRQGMLAQAIIIQDLNAGITTIVDSDDLLLLIEK